MRVQKDERTAFFFQHETRAIALLIPFSPGAPRLPPRRVVEELRVNAGRRQQDVPNDAPADERVAHGGEGWGGRRRIGLADVGQLDVEVLVDGVEAAWEWRTRGDGE